MGAAEGIIDGVTGDIGGGKSNYVVKGGVQQLARGGIWATNIDIKVDPWYSDRYKKNYCGMRQVLKERFGWDLQEGQLIRLPPDCWDRVHDLIPESRPDYPVLVTLDEALEGYDSLDRNDNGKRLKAVLSFVRHCRHYCVNLQYLVQTLDELNNRIRSKLTKIVYTRDTDKMRVPYLRIPYPIRGCFLVQWYKKSFTGFPIWQAHEPKQKWVFSCYDTGEKALASVQCGLGMASDFRGKGKVDDMTIGEKYMLYGSWVVASVGVVLGGYGVLRPSSPGVYLSVPARAAIAASANTNETLFLPWSASDGVGRGVEGVLIEGCWYRTGGTTPHGEVIAITENIILCRKEGKIITLVRTAPKKIEDKSKGVKV